MLKFSLNLGALAVNLGTLLANFAVLLASLGTLSKVNGIASGALSKIIDGYSRKKI